MVSEAYMHDLKLNEFGDLDVVFGNAQSLTDFAYVAQYVMMLTLSDPGDIPFDMKGGLKLSQLVGRSNTDQQLSRIQNNINYKLSKYNNGVEDAYCELERTNGGINIKFFYYDTATRELLRLPTYAFTNEGEFLYSRSYSSARETSLVNGYGSFKMEVDAKYDRYIRLDTIVPTSKKFVGIYKYKPTQKSISKTVRFTVGSKYSLSNLINSKGIDYNKIVLFSVDFSEDISYTYRYMGNDVQVEILDSEFSAGTLTINYFNAPVRDFVIEIDQSSALGQAPNAHRNIGGGFIIRSDAIKKADKYYIVIGRVIKKTYGR